MICFHKLGTLLLNKLKYDKTIYLKLNYQNTESWRKYIVDLSKGFK